MRLDRLPEKQRQRIRLMHGSLSYRDQRLRRLRRGPPWLK